jgi:iron complex transport system permease protein
VLAGIVALAAWGRTVMEDGGSLDPLRPALAGAMVLLGVVAVLCLALPAADVPDRVVTDPRTGLQTVVTVEGPQALLERPGLALLGGLLLAGALLLCAVTAPSLRPRLGAVGGLLGIAVFLLASGLTGLRDAGHGADVEWTVPGAGLLAVGVLAAGLTLLAWRWRGRRPGAA